MCVHTICNCSRYSRTRTPCKRGIRIISCRWTYRIIEITKIGKQIPLVIRVNSSHPIRMQTENPFIQCASIDTSIFRNGNNRHSFCSTKRIPELIILLTVSRVILRLFLNNRNVLRGTNRKESCQCENEKKSTFHGRKKSTKDTPIY